MVRHALIAGLTACAPWSFGEEDGLRVASTERLFSATDDLVVEVDVREGDTSFLTTLQSDDEDALLFVQDLVDPTGEVVFQATDWWSGTFTKTNAAFAAATTTLAWPVSADDPPLTPGRWVVRAARAQPSTATRAHIAIKQDDDLAAGTLDLHVRLVDAVAGDAALAGAVDEALAIWADEIYAGLGLSLTWTVEAVSGPASVNSPGFGMPDVYREQSADKPLRTVIVYVVERIVDTSGIFGAAGGIPGPLVPSDRSVVAVSALEAAGVDGTYDDEEVALLAETMAHEVGHYLGLYHPVELPTDALTGPITTWDSLADTPECQRLQGCANQIGTNLMFPTPLCEVSNGARCTRFVRQHQLTNAQRGVAHRYVGVR